MCPATVELGFYQPTQIVVLTNDNGVLRAPHLLTSDLKHDSPNALRRLFLDNRERLIEALMHEKVLVPEGRIDYEFLRLLTDAVDTTPSVRAIPEHSRLFGAAVGLVPTHDAAICVTLRALADVRGELVAVVDGDSPGDGYVTSMAQEDRPPQAVVQWPKGWLIEDVVGWILEAGGAEVVHKVSSNLGRSYSSHKGLIDALKQVSRPYGLKQDYLAYEAIVAAIQDSEPCVLRAADLLGDLYLVASGRGSESPRVSRDQARSTDKLNVFRWQP